VTPTRVAALAAGAAFAVLLATTRPFTVEADAVTAVGLAAGAAALGLRLWQKEGVASVAPAAVVGAPGTPVPWLALLGAVVAWELYCFFGGARPAHPTLSTVYDLLARYEAAKALVVASWLALGWELVR